MEPPRIGAYGGTFDPIHCGHVEVASALVGKFAMDELLIIPAASPPHKDPRGLSSSHHRFAMAALGTLPVPRVLVSALEIDSPASPYTFETVARLRALYGPTAELYFIIGSDSFEEMHTWRRPDLIVSNSNLIVAARPGYGMSNPQLSRLFAPDLESHSTTRDNSEEAGTGGSPWPARIIDLTGDRKPAAVPPEGRPAGSIFLTDYVTADISSTEIRHRAARNLDIRGMVPEGVAAYITKYKLYQGRRAGELQ